MKHKIISPLFKLLGIYLCIQFWSAPFFWWIMAIYFLVFIAVIALGSAFIQLNYHIKSLSKGKGTVLSFDDGPHPINTPKILETLKKYNVKAVFFVIGKHAEQYPELVKRIFDEGHTIGLHSYSHSNVLPWLPKKKLLRDFEKCKSIISDIIGETSCLIRPPFGVTSPSYTCLLRKTNYTSIGWTVRSLDTVAKDKESLFKRVLKGLKSNDETILFHDSIDITVQVLPELLEHFNKKGIDVASVSEAFSILPYDNKK